MGRVLSISGNSFYDTSSIVVALLVFLAAATLAFSVMAVIRVRGSVKRRTARIMDEARGR